MNELVLQLEEDTVASSAASSVGGRGTPIPGPESGLLSNTQTYMLTQSRDFTGKGHGGGGQQGEGAQEDRSATGLAVSGFVVMGLVSGLLWQPGILHIQK